MQPDQTGDSRSARPGRAVLTAAGFIAAALLLLAVTAGSGRAVSPAPAQPPCEAPRASGSSHTAGPGGLMLPSTLDQMTDESDLVLVGTVQSLQNCLDGGGASIVTFVSIASNQLLKGNAAAAASGRSITLNVPGGSFGRYWLAV